MQAYGYQENNEQQEGDINTSNYNRLQVITDEARLIISACSMNIRDGERGSSDVFLRCDASIQVPMLI